MQDSTINLIRLTSIAAIVAMAALLSRPAAQPEPYAPVATKSVVSRPIQVAALVVVRRNPCDPQETYSGPSPYGALVDPNRPPALCQIAPTTKAPPSVGAPRLAVTTDGDRGPS